MPFADLSRFKMHYECAGEGPARLVLVHGNFASWRWWLPLLLNPPPGYRLFAPEMRGYGDSEHTAGGYDIETFADDLNEFAAGLHLNRFHLVGHSLGGAVALQYALQYPERLQSLFLLSPAPAEGMPSLSPDLKLRYGINLSQPAGMENLPYVLKSAHINRVLLSPILTAITPQLNHESGLFSVIVEDAVRVSPETVSGVIQSLQGWNVERRLPEVEIPVLILWGDRDPVIAGPPLERMAHALPRAEFVVWPGTGHAPQLEQPERFYSLLTSFIDKHAGAGEPAQPPTTGQPRGLLQKLKNLFNRDCFVA
jgi:pimeloyl-ACP methyl ester carboxylesterase